MKCRPTHNTGNFIPVAPHVWVMARMVYRIVPRGHTGRNAPLDPRKTSKSLRSLWDSFEATTSHIGGCGRMSDPRGVALRRVPASSWNAVLIRGAAACGVRWPSWLSRDNTPRNASRLPLRCGRRICGVWRETSFLQDQLGERVAVGWPKRALESV